MLHKRQQGRSEQVADTQFKKGQKSGPGRPKGAANKVTKELKEMILSALDGAGGVDYLQERAKDPRTASAFLTLVGKVLPMTVQGSGDGGALLFQAIERRVVDPANPDG